MKKPTFLSKHIRNDYEILISLFFAVCLMGCTTDSTDTGDSRTIFPTPPAIVEPQTVDALPEQTPLINVVENAVECP